MEMALISLPPPLPLPRPQFMPPFYSSLSINTMVNTSTSTCKMKMHMKMHKRRIHLLCTSQSMNSDPDQKQNQNQNQNQNQKQNNPPPWISIWLQLKLKPILLRLQAALAFFQHQKHSIPFPGWISKPIATSLLLLSASLLLCALIRCGRTRVNLVPYSDLVTGIQLGHVSAVHFEEGSRRIYFRHHHHAKTQTQSYLTRKMDRDEKFLLGLLRQHGVMYRSIPPPVSRLLLSCIGTIAGLWIGVIPLIWILERRLHGNSTNKNTPATTQTVSFHDVQGVDSAKQELIELVNCLQGTLDYKKLGAKLPTGILLVGPPGTGKTLLARAFAGEAGVPFFSISASEFVELYVGRGAARVRDLFKEARRQAPAVVFIDELDAVGTERDGFSAERDQTLNQLLTEMDGFDSDNQVIVLAATNRPAALDPALLRPGRFSRKVLVGEPDLEGRKRILAVHLKRVPLEEEMEVVCDLVASLTEGFVGADLANIANEAALLAVRRGGGLVMREDIMEAVEREKFGITENKANGVRGSKGLVKLLPWLPSLTQGSLRNKKRDRNAIGSRRVLSF